tara:strand:+ start:46302 stop:46994 length:693 start_codon:yes stop_codon:yes gene_type:complete
MASIPLEEDLNWWWYKAKNNLLNHILRKEEFNKYNKILEIGPGLGNNLKLLNQFGIIDILEIENEFINSLKNNYSEIINEIYEKIEDINAEYDLIIMLDILEHIENSEEFMKKVKKIIKKNGKIVIGVPAYQSLWSSHDEALKHFRRYTWNTLQNDCNVFNITKKYGFNYLTFPIRFLQIKFGKSTISTKNHSSLINTVLYSISLLEHFLRKIGINPKFGISIYAVLKNE